VDRGLTSELAHVGISPLDSEAAQLSLHFDLLLKFFSGHHPAPIR
jgi:hypothetical protein